ncbi:hypothetical protein R1sor_022032 [Riccia sorocarpa]|uniref:Uncharacterized protein n=1 Tax=Riccia sorocarpa TaxID=122646 RepID=A0ABD3GMI1_9MARC
MRGDTNPKIITADVHNAADHWASNHNTCRTLPGARKCVVENWPQGRDCKYPEGGETHKAIEQSWIVSEQNANVTRHIKHEKSVTGNGPPSLFQNVTTE